MRSQFEDVAERTDVHGELEKEDLFEDVATG
jgi:hypothetical protein